MKSILDKSFKYTPSAETDIRKTFAKARKELAEQAKPVKNVMPIKKKVSK